MSKLILPGDPLFDRTLAMTPPANWREIAARTTGEFAFIMRSDSGLMEPVSHRELDEYLYGGEYEERLEDVDEEAYLEIYGEEGELDAYLEIVGSSSS